MSRSNTNNIELNIPIGVIYKLYKPGDIIIGDLITNDKVISNEVICEIGNRYDVKDIKTTNVAAKIINVKCTSGRSYFLSEGQKL